MGVIQNQSSKSGIFILIGQCIGAFNILILFPKFLSIEEIGLTRAILDTSTTLMWLCLLGTIPVINKFNPFYVHYLGSKKNDLPLITFIVILIGFCIVTTIGIYKNDFIIKKLGRSPSFATYFNYVYPCTFLFLLFGWLEIFAYTIRKTVLTNFLKETLMRILSTLLIVIYALHLISFKSFIFIFSILYFPAVCILFFEMIRSKKWSFNFVKISSVTKRLKARMISFGGFVFMGNFLSVLARTNDTFLIFGLRGLSDTGIFTIATYLSTIIEIPQRSLLSASAATVAESWQKKDLKNIKDIYNKSVSNLMLIGLLLFGLMIININNLEKLLILISADHNKSYQAIGSIFFILGVAKLIDLSTGINGAIINNSNYWKFDFFTNVIFIVLSIPLNYFLIIKYGLVGLAYSNLASISIYNFIRYLFLYYKFNFQPYQWKHLKILLTTTTIIIVVYALPSFNNFIIDSILRSVLFLFIMYQVIAKINPAPELTNMFFNFLERKNIKLLNRF